MSSPVPSSERAWVAAQVAAGLDRATAEEYARQRARVAGWTEDDEALATATTPTEEPGLEPRPPAAVREVPPGDLEATALALRAAEHDRYRAMGASDEKAWLAANELYAKAQVDRPDLWTPTIEAALEAAEDPTRDTPAYRAIRSFGRGVSATSPLREGETAVEARQEERRQAIARRRESPFTLAGLERREDLGPVPETPELDGQLRELRAQRDAVSRRATPGSPEPEVDQALRVLDAEHSRLTAERWRARHPLESAALELVRAGWAKQAAVAGKASRAARILSGAPEPEESEAARLLTGEQGLGIRARLEGHEVSPVSQAASLAVLAVTDPEGTKRRAREAWGALTTPSQEELDAQQRIEEASPAAAERVAELLGLGSPFEGPSPLAALVEGASPGVRVSDVSPAVRLGRSDLAAKLDAALAEAPEGTAQRAGLAAAKAFGELAGEKEPVVPEWMAELSRFTERKLPGVAAVEAAGLRAAGAQEAARALRSLYRAATGRENWDARAQELEEAESPDQAWLALGALRQVDVPGAAGVQVDLDAFARHLEGHPDAAGQAELAPVVRALLAWTDDTDEERADAVRAALAQGADAAQAEEQGDRTAAALKASRRAELFEVARNVPLGAWPASVVTWNLDQVKQAVRERREASAAAGGVVGEAIPALLGQVGTAPRPFLKGRMESTAGWWMRVGGGTAANLLLEADVPMAAGGGPLAYGLHALTEAYLADPIADDPTAPPVLRAWATTTRDLRMPAFGPVPSRAGIDRMLASESPVLGAVRQAIGIDTYTRVDPDHSTWWARVGADAETGIGGAFMHTADILHNAGVEEGSAVDNALKWYAVGLDTLFPWEWATFGVPVAVGVRGKLGLQAVRLAREAGGGKARAPVGTFLRGAMPEVWKRPGSDADWFAMVHAAVMRSAMEGTAEGRNVLDGLSGGDREVVAEVLRVAGVDPRQVFDGYEAAVQGQRRVHVDAVREVLKHGGPEDKALRASAPYKALQLELKKVVAAGQITPEEALLYLGVREQRAWWEVANGTVKTPEESFARSPVEVRSVGGGPGVGAGGPAEAGGAAPSAEGVPRGGPGRGPGAGDLPSERGGEVVGTFGAATGRLALNEGLVKAARPDLYEHLTRAFGRDPTTGGLTRRGQEAAAVAWRWYMRTRLAPSGYARKVFDGIYLSLQDVWARTRGRASVLPPELVRAWDDEYRPVSVVANDVATLGAEALRKEGFPRVRIDVTLGEEAQQGNVRAAGQKREAQRVGMRRDEVLDALGVKAGEDVPVHELVAKTVAYVKTEQARRLFGTGELVVLSDRTVVPRSRVGRVTDEARGMLVDALGTTPDKLTVKGDRISLTPEQAARVRVMAGSVAKEPMGGRVPMRLVLPGSDLSTITLDELHALQDAAIDTRAGVAARRARRAEAVPPTVGYALVQAMNGGAKGDRFKAGMTWAAGGAVMGAVAGGPFGAAAGGLAGAFLGSHLDWLKDQFTVRRPAEGYADPLIQESVERVSRGMAQAQNEVLRGIRDFMAAQKKAAGKGAKAAVVDSLHGARRVLNPPVDPGNVGVIRDWLAVLEHGDDPEAVLKHGDDPEGAPAVLNGLLDHAALETIGGALDEMGGQAPREKAALSLLHAYAELGVEKVLADPMATRFAVEAMMDVRNGLARRWRGIRQRAQNLVVTFAGSTDKNVLVNLGDGDYAKVYNWFYQGEWDALLDWMATKRGLETGREVRRVPQMGTGDALLEALVRMRALDKLEGFAEDLTRLGMDLEVEGLAPNTVLDRSAFAQRVLYYINGEVSWAGVVELVDEMTGDIVGRPAAPTMWPEMAQAMKETAMSPAAVRAAAMERVAGGPIVTDAPDGPGNPHDLVAYTVAHQILDKLGWKHGKGVWELYELPDGRQIALPDMMAEYMGEALGRAAAVGRARGAKAALGLKVTGSLTRPAAPGVAPPRVAPGPASASVEGRPLGVAVKAAVAAPFEEVLELMGGLTTGIKLNTTVGMLIPNVASYVGNFIGGVFQVYQRAGVKGVGSAGFSEPAMTMAVVRRLRGMGDRAQGTAMMVDRAGRLWTPDRAADVAEREGLASSLPAAESARAMARDIRDMHRPFWQKMMLAPVYWERLLVDVWTASDNFWRTGVFLHELKQGKAPQAAAASARAAMFDYSALSDTEKTVMRNVVFFYAYLRKNADLWWDTFLTHPERILGQLRLMRDMNAWFLEEEPQLVLRDDLDTRLMIAYRKAAVDTARKGGVAHMAPPLPVSDIVNLMVGTYDVVGGNNADGQAARRLTNVLAPWVHLPEVEAYGVDPFYGGELERYEDVPGWFVQLAYLTGTQALLMDVFGVRPVREPDPSKWTSATDPVVWKPGGTRQQAVAWWVFKNMGAALPGLGRGMDTVTRLDRANLGLVEAIERTARQARFVADREVGDGETFTLIPTGDPVGPRYGLTVNDELAGFLGFPAVSIPRAEEAVRGMERAKSAQLEEERRRREKEAMPGPSEGLVP